MAKSAPKSKSKDLQELLDILKKDEQLLRNTITNADGQLRYNLKMQVEIEKILAVTPVCKAIKKV